ncbi:RNA polymerase subunit sigma-70, partial [filamentous cyanobacterium CCP4]
MCIRDRGQRLVRAKSKIRDAGIPFELPAIARLPSRLEAVLEAIYAAYNRGWDSFGGADVAPVALADEAIWLARLCVELLPQAAEARGLLALMLYCEARHLARRSPTGAYVPLSQQNTALWSVPLLQEAEDQLLRASRLKQLGRFQLEAAIQSVHAQRASVGVTDWQALVQLYSGLVQIAPTLGAWVGRAAAIAQAYSPTQGLEALDNLPLNKIKTYQPYWALRGHLLAEVQQCDEARACYSQAIELSTDAAVRRFLTEQMAEC